MNYIKFPSLNIIILYILIKDVLLLNYLFVYLMKKWLKMFCIPCATILSIKWGDNL